MRRMAMASPKRARKPCLLGGSDADDDRDGGGGEERQDEGILKLLEDAGEVAFLFGLGKPIASVASEALVGVDGGQPVDPARVDAFEERGDVLGMHRRRWAVPGRAPLAHGVTASSAPAPGFDPATSSSARAAASSSRSAWETASLCPGGAASMRAGTCAGFGGSGGATPIFRLSANRSSSAPAVCSSFRTAPPGHRPNTPRQSPRRPRPRPRSGRPSAPSGRRSRRPRIGSSRSSSRGWPSGPRRPSCAREHAALSLGFLDLVVEHPERRLQLVDGGLLLLPLRR